MISNNVEQHDQSPEGADGPSKEHGEHPKPEVTSVALPAKPQPPPSESSNHPAKEKDRDLLDYVKFGAELLGLGVLIAYTIFSGLQACIMNRTLDEIKKQTSKISETADTAKKTADFTRQQLVGAQAAIIEATYPQLKERGSQVEIVFANRGHVVGHASAEIFVVRLHPNGGETILAHESFSNSPVAVERPVVKTFVIADGKHGFTPSELKSIMADTPRQVLVIKGAYSYEDGFGDTYPGIAFCYSLMGHPQVTFDTGTTMWAGVGFNPCDSWNAARKLIADAERRPQRPTK
jgi:hypothetical protein